jgi:formylmethanofuran dehydrogenase subunit B
MADRGPVTCAGCGLLCDDVILEGADDSVRLRPECSLGAEWFAKRMRRPADVPAATVDGRPVGVEAALDRAAELLRGARRPLVHGFDGATVEDARAAVALADRLGALIATGDLAEVWSGAPAVALRGASSATLGEIRDRSRLVVIWREDPETTHPRLLERLGFREGARVPTEGARVPAEGARVPADGVHTLVVVDDRDTSTARRADVRLRWPPERDLEALISLHALHRRLTLRPSELQAPLHGLLEQVGDVPHAAVVYGPGLTAGAGGQRRALALHELVRALCHERHVVTLALPRAAGATAAQDVLAWQTGYGGAVDLAGGHPELVTGTGPLLDGEGVDVAVRVEGEGVDAAVRVEGAPRETGAGVAEIALGSRPAGPDVRVSIRTAAPGVCAAGTAHRLDGVPLALQAPQRDDAPTAAALLMRLLAEVQR